jgi:phosphoribosylaminoimidazolecarboxamide formyltransferase/IMP cyclohydrolase
MKQHGISEIDLLVVNLYPFENTVARGADYATCIENIDIGGPAMIRAAAKNHQFVTVITETSDYGLFWDEFETNKGCTSLNFRRKMAYRAYSHTAGYDASISSWMSEQEKDDNPKKMIEVGSLVQNLRYGENPHQRAAFYKDNSNSFGVGSAFQHQGKELSYNNINDTDAALELVCEFDQTSKSACAIIKHANPCGVATGVNLKEAYKSAVSCDQTSAFGGVVALNQILDKPTAEEICSIFTEVVIAPGVTAEALEIFAKKKNLRLLTTGDLKNSRDGRKNIRHISGGFLVQDRDTETVLEKNLNIVTKRKPTHEELEDMLFAWKVAKHVKSNAIVYAKNNVTVGIGAGQMSRVDSCRIAAQKSIDMAENLSLDFPLTKGSAVASDAFFPFSDGLMVAAEAGATAIIQPGGSMRDEEVIKAADDANLAMAFTGIRHFRH